MASYFLLCFNLCVVIIFFFFRARVVDKPYGPLVQNYQQCKNDKYNTLLNQAGIATGNI